MDKYDILFCIDGIKNFISFLKNKKEFHKNYLIRKKDWLSMEYYKLRVKRSSEYNKKFPSKSLMGIYKVLDLKKGQKYVWDLLKPMENK